MGSHTVGMFPSRKHAWGVVQRWAPRINASIRIALTQPRRASWEARARGTPIDHARTRYKPYSNNYAANSFGHVCRAPIQRRRPMIVRSLALAFHRWP